MGLDGDRPDNADAELLQRAERRVQAQLFIGFRQKHGTMENRAAVPLFAPDTAWLEIKGKISSVAGIGMVWMPPAGRVDQAIP